jgi:hypothetical protein
MMRENLKNFSIGSIVQIKPMGGNDEKESIADHENGLDALMLEESYHGNLVRMENYSSILNKVLILAMGYFTVATELRLLAGEKYKNCSEYEKE